MTANTHLMEMKQPTTTTATATANGKQKRKGREYSDEERAAIAHRLAKAKADKFGLTVEQWKALKLRPGAAPSEADIKRVKKQYPAKKGS